MRPSKWTRWVSLVLTPAILLGSAQTVLGDTQFTQTDNPIAIGPPVEVPSSTPTTLQILNHQTFGNAAPPVKSTVNLPTGHWAKAILTITGTQHGRQYDRLLKIWAGNTQIFTGVTPEPTEQGISWKVQKDISDYLPVLTGKQDFTTELANYVNSTYTGIPDVSVSLALYPAHEKSAGNADAKGSNPWDLKVPDSIVPLTSSASSSVIHPGNTMTETLDLPNDIKSAYLDLYAIGQSNDEFWWANQPAFREVEISIDGKPAGVVWPFPYVYTGGVNAPSRPSIP